MHIHVLKYKAKDLNIYYIAFNVKENFFLNQ